MAIKALSAIEVATPTSEFYATNKGYVDDNFMRQISTYIKTTSNHIPYEVGDLVWFNDTLWKCTKTTTSEFEFSPSNWSVAISRKAGYVAGTFTSNAIDSERNNIKEGICAFDYSNFTVGGGGGVSLRPATSSTLGGVMVDNTTITIDGNGVVSLKPATSSTLGGVKVDNITITIDGNGVVSANGTGAGSLLHISRTSVFAATSANSYTITGIRNPTTDIDPPSVNYAGFLWTVAASAANIKYRILLPDISRLPGIVENASCSSVITYEIMVRVKQSSNSTSGSASFKFFESVSTLPENSGFDTATCAVVWLDKPPISLERGYVYFIVLRNIAYGDYSSTTSIKRKWIGNIQGKIAIDEWS